MPPVLRLATALVVTAATLTLACGGSTPVPDELRGTELSPPWPKPEFTLTTSGGEPFDFHRDTAGFTTLLFFGYTHCPDVCPVHLANIAAVLRTLPPDVTSRVRVVFVTTDPDRDTPERVRSWLAGFDPRFVGLVGPIDSVNVIQQRVGLAPAVKTDRPGARDGRYLVAHAAQVVAYTPDDLAHVVYPFGTRQSDWAHDLPLLASAPWRSTVVERDQKAR